MIRYIAFLRAINVGGHIVKMQDLRRLFESWGLSAVQTYIQSGNVVFEADGKRPRDLEKVLEERLQEALGYRVATFLRTERELADIAKYWPFPARGRPVEEGCTSVFCEVSLPLTYEKH
jgi:uncharacterized protein (DUF1697 family)